MLTFPRLIVRNLAYHWRGNLAVVLGVAVGSAVLTGALLVGDSLRGSLRARVERQLAGIDTAAMFHRPLPAEIANGLPGHTAPVLLLPGSLQVAGDDPAAPSLGRVTILGVDDRFKLASGKDSSIDWNGAGKQVAVSHRVAAKLAVKVGDRVKLAVERFSDIPRSSLFAKRSLDESLATLTLIVAAILPSDAPENDFNLTPNPATPLNIFVPLRTLSDLVQNELGESKSFPAKATTLLSSGAIVEELNAALRPKLTIADFGLKVRVVERAIDKKQRETRGYLSVESDQLVMDDATAAAVEKIAAKHGMRAEPTIVYLVNSISDGKAEIPYSIVAGLNPSADPPLGPFKTDKGVVPSNKEIVLLDWPDSPLRGLKDDGSMRLTLSYYNPEVEGEGRLETKSLIFRGYVPFSGAANDRDLPINSEIVTGRDLTPAVKGMTDENVNLLNWNRPPQLDNKKVREKIKSGDVNERFWNKYRATPKAYVNLVTAKELFGSRYGSVTSIRIAPAAGETPQTAGERLRSVLAKELDPASAGLIFDPIRERLLKASHGGTDFGGLFLGFSLFLIAAALMLVGLLFRLTLDRRAKEVGLLLATGFAVRDIRRVLLAEGLALTIIGALIGLAIGVGYNRLLIQVLVELWPDKEVATILRPYSTSFSFITGFGLTLVMAIIALWFSIRGLVRVTPPALLRGETIISATVVKTGSPVAWPVLVCSLPIGTASIVAGKYIDNPDYQAMTFFAGGGLLLTAGLAAVWIWMKRTRHAVVNGRGLPALATLGGRNAARNRTRSILTSALLASAAFLLVAVESFRRQPGIEFLDKNGGSGGFNLIAETDIPMFQSFDSGPGHDDLESRLQEVYGGTSTDPRYQAALTVLRGIEVYPLRLRDGDDASCMNLFQATRPRVLGVPDRLIERDGFKFYASEATTPAEKENPWLLLRKSLPGGAIPIFCEQNTAQWMLKTAVGGEIKMPGDEGGELTLRIVGTLTDSPFQSELLMSDVSFAKAFPKTGGYRIFLVRTPPGQEEAVGRVLTVGLRANGLIATPTRERVAAYQAVIGAYLSTFQLLGGLGLLLGVLGLAVVVLRGVWERLGELALLRAMGYRTRQLQFLVLAENALLLIAGLGIGVLAALASVAPHVVEGAALPWLRLSGLLFLVLVVGLVVASVSTAGILRVPLIPALRQEKYQRGVRNAELGTEEKKRAKGFFRSALRVPSSVLEESAMIKLGILDFDTSHTVEFTRRLNHTEGTPKDQFVEGAQVVVGCAGESKLSPERVAGFTEQMKKFGIPLVEKPEEMIVKVDGMLIEAVDGTVHYERAKPFLEAGIPCFIDKPFTCSVADAKKILELSEKKKAAVFSSSSLRYAPEIVQFATDPQHGKIVGCEVYGPASLSPIPERNAGLYHYGIHPIEMLYTIMGPGCKRVTCIHDKGVDQVTGQWKDGRVATMRGIREGASGYGFTGFSEKTIKAVTVGTSVIYRELLKQIVEFFKTGKSPVEPAVMLEIMSFIEAANKSAANHGAGESIQL